MRKYNCKVYNICVILYPNDQGREIIYLIEPNASSFFSHENLTEILLSMYSDAIRFKNCP